MNLMITGERLISDVQGEFSAQFPYLKIEFFKNGNRRRDHYPLIKLIPHHQHVSDAWFSKRNEGELEISNTMTVSELENALMDRFGLSAQLFRKSGNLWLETTITDMWTLKQQNDHGREISTDHKSPGAEEVPDYDLNR